MCYEIFTHPCRYSPIKLNVTPPCDLQWGQLTEIGNTRTETCVCVCLWESVSPDFLCKSLWAQSFTKNTHIKKTTHMCAHTHTCAHACCQPCRPAHNVFHLNTLQLQSMLWGSGDRDMSEIEVRRARWTSAASLRSRCVDRALTRRHGGGRRMLVFQVTSFRRPRFLMEECVFNLDFSLLNLPPLPSSRAPSTASLPHSSPSPSASPRLFSVTRGLAGDKPMSAEDVGRVGGTEEKGRWRGEEGEWKAVSNADLFWADKRRTLCAEATGFNLGAATFGINYHTYSSTAAAYCVHGYYIHSNTNFIQLMCWNLVLHRSFLLLLWYICIKYSCTEMLVHKGERGQQDISFFFLLRQMQELLKCCYKLRTIMFGVDVGLTGCECTKMNVLHPVGMFKAVLLISIGCEPVPNLASWICFVLQRYLSTMFNYNYIFNSTENRHLLAKLLSFYSAEHC